MTTYRVSCHESQLLELFEHWAYCECLWCEKCLLCRLWLLWQINTINYQNVLGIAPPLIRCTNEKTNTNINDDNTNDYLLDSLFTENKRCAIFMLIVDSMLSNNWEYLYDAIFSRDTAFTFHWRISTYAFSTFYKRVNGMFDVVDFFVSSFKQVFFKSQIKHMTQCIKPQTYRLHCIVLAEKW